MSAPQPPRRFITPLAEVSDEAAAEAWELVERGARRRAAGLRAAQTRRRRERQRAAEEFGATARAALDRYVQERSAGDDE